MTNLEALQAMLEYENDNLLTKALLDRSVTATTTYAAAQQKGVELAAADIYLVLLNHPKYRAGSRFIEYSNADLLSLRRTLLKKHGELSATISVPQDSRNNQSW